MSNLIGGLIWFVGFICGYLIRGCNEKMNKKKKEP